MKATAEVQTKQASDGTPLYRVVDLTDPKDEKWATWRSSLDNAWEAWARRRRDRGH